MAISKNILSKNLVVNAEAGMDASGNIKFKAYSFSGVNQAATNDAIYAVGTALAGLMNGEAESICVVEKVELLED